MNTLSSKISSIPQTILIQMKRNLEVKFLFYLVLTLMSFSLYLGCTSEDLERGATVDPNGEESTITPLIDSNTNWLLSCSADADCEEGEQCSCGSCVIPCLPMSNEMNHCMTALGHSQSEVVECAEVEPVSDVASCGEDYSRGHVGICLLACETNDECPNRLLCHEGRCVRPRRGESRGCGDARECIEAGGAPERCRILCEDDMEGDMSMERAPPPPVQEIVQCTRRCVEAGYSRNACYARCAICAERCLLIEDSLDEQACQTRCQRREER